MHYIIAGNTYRSGLIYQCGDDVVVIEKNTFKRHKFHKEDKLYISSEEGLEMALNQSDNIRHIGAIQTLKDKFAARKEIERIYPDFFFKKSTLQDLPKEKLDFEKCPKYIVKPLRGFFGTAVREIEADTDLNALSEEIRGDLERNIRFFTGSVISQEELIIEEFIEGEEYAVDMYYDCDGEPIILSLTHHPKSKFREYGNVLYYTNAEIFNKLYNPVLKFFRQLSPKPSITSFPIHAEFKLTARDQLIPIEMNPLRFGGFGLADLTYYAFQINPFYAYFNDLELDWPALWEENKDLNFGFVLAYNGSNVELDNVMPNDTAFKKYLGHALIRYIPLDHLENPVFAICYVKSKNIADLTKLLALDFNDCF